MDVSIMLRTLAVAASIAILSACGRAGHEDKVLSPASSGGATSVANSSLVSGVYTTPQLLTLSCPEGAAPQCQSIYYSFDGNAPASAFIRYEQPLVISQSISVRYYVVAQDGIAGNIQIRSFVLDIEKTPPVTTASLLPGDLPFNSAQTVYLSCSDNGSGCDKIFYTTDGSIPDVRATVYDQEGIALIRDTTLRFFAVDKSGNSESSKSYFYKFSNELNRIESIPPVTKSNLLRGDGPYLDAQTIYLTCADADSGCDKIYYTTDGTMPNTASVVYSTQGITLTHDTLLRFFAVDKVGNRETTKARLYEFSAAMNGTSKTIAGGNHTLKVNPDGTLESWGNGDFAQLGNGALATSSVPVLVNNKANKILSAAGGREFSLAITDNRAVLQWGASYDPKPNSSAITVTLNLIPRLLLDVSNNVVDAIVDISTSYKHALLLKQNGTVLSWGVNLEGSLGDGSRSASSIVLPVVVNNQGDLLRDVVDVATGYSHSLALKKDGTVWAWGSNNSGKLGDGSTVPSSLFPVQTKDKDGRPLQNIIAIEASMTASIALDQNGHVWSWGSDTYGELGSHMDPLLARFHAAEVVEQSGKALDHVVAISSKGLYTLALKDDGTLWGWGANELDSLGNEMLAIRPFAAPIIAKDGAALNNVASVSAGSAHNIIQINGQTQGWGSNRFEQLATPYNKFTYVPQVVGTIASVQHVFSSPSASQTLAIGDDNSLWMWGGNWIGNLGMGDKVTRTVPGLVKFKTPILITKALSSFDFSLAIDDTGSLWSWGLGATGRYLASGDNVDRLTPGLAYSAKNVVMSGISDISVGAAHALALNEVGEIWSWGGENINGELGRPYTSASTLIYPDKVVDTAQNPISGVTQITSGLYHNLALKSGTVLAWGYNGWGLLGDGTFINRARPVAVVHSDATPLTNIIQIAAGQVNSLALDQDGTVWSWGYNAYGQLGNGGVIHSAFPVKVMLDSVNMFDNVAAVAAGNGYSVALRHDGTVWVWGDNIRGTLAVNPVSQTMSRYPQQVLLEGGVPLTGATEIAAGIQHIVVRLSDGRMLTWGTNLVGELGQSDILQTPNAVVLP